MRRRRGRGEPWRASTYVGAGAPNQRWSLDFVHDQLSTGRRFRECLVAVVDASISGGRVVRQLSNLVASVVRRR